MRYWIFAAMAAFATASHAAPAAHEPDWKPLYLDCLHQDQACAGYLLSVQEDYISSYRVPPTYTFGGHTRLRNPSVQPICHRVAPGFLAEWFVNELDRRPDLRALSSREVAMHVLDDNYVCRPSDGYL